MEENPTVAIIPARGGSKRVLGKNALILNGRPLLAHTIEHAFRARQVDVVYVSTEDPRLAEIAIQYGAEVIPRPADLAVDSTAVMPCSLMRSAGYVSKAQIRS